MIPRKGAKKKTVTFDLPGYDGWQPRADQVSLFQYFENGGLKGVEVAHRRWGKDEIALRLFLYMAHKRIGNYWHMLPLNNQGRKAIWESVNPLTGHRRIDENFPELLRTDTRETDMFIRFKSGSTYQVIGSDSYKNLLGSPPVGVVYSEFGLTNPMAWGEVSPILEQNGGWAMFIGVPAGDNHFKRIFDFARSELGQKDGWYAELIDAYHSPVFTLEQLEREKRNLIATFGEDQGLALFSQNYECQWGTVVIGSYFGKQMKQLWSDRHITRVPWRPDLEVETFWDLGVDDSTSIWFMQQVGKQYLFIDYYEATGYAMGHYAKVLKEKPYVYGNHWMPHDVEQRHMSQESEIARSVREVAEALGVKPVITVRRPRNMDDIIYVHIPAIRNILPSCWFDEIKCAQGIACLENYAAEYDEEKKVQSNRPLHNWCSHGVDSFRTMVAGYRPVDTARIQSVSEYMQNIDLHPFGG